MEDFVIRLKNVNKTFKIRRGGRSSVRKILINPFEFFFGTRQEIKALRDINLDVQRGGNLGIVGSNGSGKSTLLNIIIGSIRADRGSKIETKGKIVRLSLGMGIDPNLTARDNIYVNASILGLSFKKIGDLFDEILEFAGIEEFVDVPIKFYSKGMKQRLLFSIAMNAEADIYLLDEFFGGTGDLDFKQKSNDAFHQKILEGKTIIIVSHSRSVIRNYCNEVIWINKGKIKMTGDAETVLAAYADFVDRKQAKKLRANQDDK